MDSTFEWNPDKDEENQRKHGVSFAEAQWAFLDPKRVVSRDVTHSEAEDRFYCFGQVPRGILTVRFTWRNGRIRIIGAGFWRRGKTFYETQNHLQQ